MLLCTATGLRLHAKRQPSDSHAERCVYSKGNALSGAFVGKQCSERSIRFPKRPRCIADCSYIAQIARDEITARDLPIARGLESHTGRTRLIRPFLRQILNKRAHLSTALALIPLEHDSRGVHRQYQIPGRKQLRDIAKFGAAR